MDKILYFGYGANKSRSKIQQIIGSDPGEGVGAVLDNYILCTQTLDQIPQEPKEILTELFGNQYQAYTIKKGQGVVLGIIWEIRPEDLNLIKNWEYVETWREIIETEVRSAGMKKVRVMTDKSMDQFPTTDIVDGLTYNEFQFTKKPKIDIEQEQYYSNLQIEKIKQWLAAQSRDK